MTSFKSEYESMTIQEKATNACRIVLGDHTVDSMIKTSSRSLRNLYNVCAVECFLYDISGYFVDDLKVAMRLYKETGCYELGED